MSNKLPPAVLVRCDLIGTISERALLLYSLISDLMHLSAENSQYHDSEGKPFVLFPADRAAAVFRIGQSQARACFKELENAGLIVRKLQGFGKPARIYLTAEKSAVKTAEKSAVKTAEKSAPSQLKESINKSHNISSSSGEICENQQTFDDLFLMMTVKDVVSEILCQLVAKNPQEFAEINAEIIDFVAENIRKAAENKKIANLRGYARQALRHGKADFETARSRPAPSLSSMTGYAATYNIAEYERYGVFDDYFYFDELPPELEHLQAKLMYKHRLYVKDLTAAEREQAAMFAARPAHCDDDN